jgi:hypothetical protein
MMNDWRARELETVTAITLLRRWAAFFVSGVRSSDLLIWLFNRVAPSHQFARKPAQWMGHVTSIWGPDQ